MEENEVIQVPPEQTQPAEEQAVSNSEPPTCPPDNSAERFRLENEAYQRHFSALQEELSEIRKKFAVEEPLPPDPVTLLTGQVTDLQNGFQQLRSMLEQQQQNQQPPVQHQAPQQIQFIQPPQYTYFPQTQPSFAPPPILPPPALPYFATPMLPPTNTQAPVINFNGNGQTGGIRR